MRVPKIEAAARMMSRTMASLIDEKNLSMRFMNLHPFSSLSVPPERKGTVSA
jgi:hypothetical protein